MKYFYETRSHGPQDQDFDVIWRFNLRESNPGVFLRFHPWPSGNSTSWGPWNPGFDSREIKSSDSDYITESLAGSVTVATLEPTVGAALSGKR